MNSDPLRIGVIGDFDPERSSHRATNDAIEHCAKQLLVPVSVPWLPTVPLEGGDCEDIVSACDGLWASPGSPYCSKEGALRAIQFARECGRPFFAT